MKKTVLIVDDEKTTREFLFDFFLLKNFIVETAKDGKEAIEKAHLGFDFVFTDMKMPKASGKEVLQHFRKHSQSIVVVMSGYSSVENAVEAMRLGAFHYLAKPLSIKSLENVVKEAIKTQKNSLRLEGVTHSLFQSKNPCMQKILQEVKKFAKSSASVFISGESGTGKEVLASTIHQLSKRKSENFIKVNCPAIAESLWESEFFGHDKGAFTGAEKKRLGRFELANKGTLLLDEVTEMPVHLQSKLLRALQEQEFERLGSETSIKVDVRIISTTNRNIEEAIDQKLFRQDLFYRLHVLPITLPPLKERKEDILDLADFFLKKFSSHLEKMPKELDLSAKKLLLDYPFPGNVRELSNLIERAVALSSRSLITASDLEIKAKKTRLLPLKEREKVHILETLRSFQGNQKMAAETLGITTRTLRNKLKEYGN